MLHNEASPQGTILSTGSSAACDAYAARQGVAGPVLMEAAGSAVSVEIQRRWSARPVLVLCGPGNNGGDGFVIARQLDAAGWPIRLALLGDRAKLTGDAAWASGLWTGPVEALDAASLDAKTGIVVDALFGAGLTRPVEGVARAMLQDVARSGLPVIAVDLPSGLSGDLAPGLEALAPAALTVSFNNLKPAHVLEPAASLCGSVVIADIGIPETWPDEVPVLARLNCPRLWAAGLPRRETATHKHREGRLLVFSGGVSATGAARLAAAAGLMAGAGLVTIASPPAALQVHAIAAQAVMVRRWEAGQATALIKDCRADTVVMGPAMGVGEASRDTVLDAATLDTPLVLDADALTSFEAAPDALFAALSPADVLTPHPGEFSRLFPDIAAGAAHKIDQTREAARRAGCVVLHKGADTVIAAPDGETVVNRHAAPHLATAGSGDVLAGVIAALIAQGMASFDAACAGAWLHGDAGLHAGTGLTADDLPTAIANARQRLDRQLAQRHALAQIRSAETRR